MSIIDRYIIRQFLLNYLILLVVLMVLIVTLDLITNIDEFAKIGKNIDGPWLDKIWATVIVTSKFYGARVLLFYVYLAGLLPIAAAAFTLASFMRNRELVAMLAGGISLFRVAMPLLAIGVGCSMLLFIDQEIFLPKLANRLSIGHSLIHKGHLKPFSIYFAPDENRSLFTAAKFNVRNSSMKDVSILRRDEKGTAIENIQASQAHWDPVNMGWQLTDGYAIRLSRNDQYFSGSNQLNQLTEVSFIPSDLDPVTIQLRRNARFRQLLSLKDLNALMSKPNIVDTRDLQRIRHSRFSLLIMNILILAMGIPYYLLRTPANLLTQTLKAAPLCIGAWAGGFIMLQIGPDSLPPAAIAWLPVLIYLPVSFYLMDKVKT